jgi:FixJ family two-component response regulator
MRYESINRRIAKELGISEVVVKHVINHRWRFIKHKMQNFKSFYTIIEHVFKISVYTDKYLERWKHKITKL